MTTETLATNNMETYSTMTENVMTDRLMTSISMTTDNMITSEANDITSANKEIEIGMLTDTCNKGNFYQCCCTYFKLLAWIHDHMLHVFLFVLFKKEGPIKGYEKG